MVRPLEKVPKIVEYLKKEKKASPTSISYSINADKRTTNSMLNTMQDMGMVEFKSFDTGKKVVSSVSLTKKFKKYWG